jgi:hypothetical protein
VPGELTCGNCGHSWSSNASSARTRCGACRTVVYVPASVRCGATSGTVRQASVAPSPREASSDADGADSYSGATVLVVIGFVVIIVIAGIIWLRRNEAPTPFTKAADRIARTRPPWSPYRAPPHSVLRPSGSAYQLTMGAITRWSCGHEATLSRPLDPGVTVATTPCPFCGHPGIAGQYFGGQFVSACP